MRSDIIIIGAGASGLMAAYSAAATLIDKGSSASVTLLEKMPRAARKVMITGKGRCNYTNLKSWQDFSPHIRSGSAFVRSAFHSLSPQSLVDFFASWGLESVVERGDRVFPSSHRASDVVDTLVNICLGKGVKIEYEACVQSVEKTPDGFSLTLSDSRKYLCRKLILATGGLSYPSTGSSGDGFLWAKALGHTITPTFPSLTALVPKGYKLTESKDRHIDRSTPLSELGEKLCGVQLKNIELSLSIGEQKTDTLFGDIDFTDGGLEGPLGFQLSRKAVKAMINGAKVCLKLDLKPGVELTELTQRVLQLWKEVDADPRSKRLREKEKCRILLGKLMPWDLIPAFTQMNPGIMTLQRISRTKTKLWVNLNSIAACLKSWVFPIDGYVGYERAVVTAGGVSLDEVVSKNLSSKLCPCLYLCGEVLDIDADTGGYNLQLAFCTGSLAGRGAALSLLSSEA